MAQEKGYAMYREIDFDLIDTDRRQPRRRFDEEKIRALKKSIEKDALVHEPIVRPHPAISGRFLLVAGERRLRALKLAGETRWQFKIDERGVDTFTMSLVENMHREDLTPIEFAEACRRLREERHMTYEEISDLTGKVPSEISALLKLLSLPKKIQDMVHEGTLPQVTALHLRQYGGSYGKLIRLAHDLAKGKDSAKLEVAQTTLQLSDRGRKMREALLPGTPAGLLLRLSNFAYRGPSTALAIRAFLQLSAEKKQEGLLALTPAVRDTLVKSFEDIVQALRDFLQEVKALSGTSGLIRVIPVDDDNARRERGYYLVFQVMKRMLYGANNKVLVNLSKVGMRGTLFRHLPLEEVEKFVLRAFRVVRDNWARGPTGETTHENKLRLFLESVKIDFKVETFAQFVEKLRNMDTSRDPIDLARLEA